MRLGSSVPEVTRSSTSTAMYEESRPGTKGSSSFSRQAMFRAAHSPWAAASS